MDNPETLPTLGTRMDNPETLATLGTRMDNPETLATLGKQNKIKKTQHRNLKR
jgi:hypothetical protein